MVDFVGANAPPPCSPGSAAYDRDVLHTVYVLIIQLVHYFVHLVTTYSYNISPVIHYFVHFVTTYSYISLHVETEEGNSNFKLHQSSLLCMSQLVDIKGGTGNWKLEI